MECEDEIINHNIQRRHVRFFMWKSELEKDHGEEEEIQL